MNARIEPVTGRYAHIEIEGREHRIYFEQAGDGIPLLCLHTAGSDGRQFRAIVNDPAITKDYRVVVFDMPWHGKSSPPMDWNGEAEYRLTSESYVAMIMAIVDALALDNSVVMGCSIGGRVVLHLAEQHPNRFRALIGLQTSAFVAPYYDLSWLYRADVHGGDLAGSIAFGLTAPTSPSEHRWETAWHYMQGGPGIFKGDLFFYNQDGDIRDRLSAIDGDATPLYFLTGEYDFSCTPADTEFVASQIAGTQATIMKDMGHFPMSENPAKFRDYLLPVLSDIKSRQE